MSADFVDFDLGLSLSDGDVSNFFQNEQTRNFQSSLALSGDGLAGVRGGLSAGIFDNAIYPDSRGFFETAGDYAFNGVQVIGGALQAIGNPISNAIEGALRDPVSILTGANDFLRSGVDVLYGATIDPIARSLGLGNGAVERNAARVQNYLGDTLGNFGDVESALALSYGNSDFNGFGKAIVGGAFATAGLIPSRAVLGGSRTLSNGVIQVDTRDAFRELSNNPLANSVYEFDGFRFETDSLGRGISSSGQLTLGNGGNRFSTDRLIGHQGLADDIGFHAGADQFGFPGGALNVSPGNRNLNSSAYKVFENTLAAEVRAGNTVTADFQRVFKSGNTSVRPKVLKGHSS